MPGLAYTPMCECTSMRPGVTQRPFASMTRAPSGAASELPTASIFPPTISTSPSSMRVPVPVSTVAPRISVGGLGAGAYVEEKGARPARRRIGRCRDGVRRLRRGLRLCGARR